MKIKNPRTRKDETEVIAIRDIEDGETDIERYFETEEDRRKKLRNIDRLARED